MLLLFDDAHDVSAENNEENDGNENAEDNDIDVGNRNNGEVRSSRLQRRQLTKKQIVNSIDVPGNINGCNPFPIPCSLKTYESILKVNNNKKRDVIRTFQNFPPRGNVGRNNRANIITGRKGPQPKAQNTSSLRTAFEIHFTADIAQSVLLHTNTKVQNTLSKLPDNFVAEDSRYSYMKEVPVEEINVFTGLYLYRGLYKLNTLSADKSVSNDLGPPIFSGTISRNRFVFIRAHLSFDEESTRENIWQHDRIAAMRKLFEVFNFDCMS